MNGGTQRPDDDGAKHFGSDPPGPTDDGETPDDPSGSWGDDAYLDELFGPRPGAGPEPLDERPEPSAPRAESIPIDDDHAGLGPIRGRRPEQGNGATQLIAGDLLLVLGGTDGTDVGPLPAGPRASHPAKPPGSVTAPEPRPLGRGVEISELSGLLQRGTSVRVGGPSGIGRTTLLRHVASLDPAGAPGGVVLLNGRNRSLDDLLQQLYDACFAGPAFRPTREQLAPMLADVAALVVVDDLEANQDEVGELLSLAPECAFLVAGPEVVDPIVRRDSPLHEITLGGLPQEASFDLLRRVAGRELDDEELAWASALWFQVGGHPGRFVQAGALLARREQGRSGFGLLDDGASDAAGELPSPGEPRQFVPRLVPLVSPSAQQVLRLASALEGELPDPVHLPALTGAVDAVGAADELVDAGLAVREYGRYRLAGGTSDAVASIVRGPSSWAIAAIQHFTWWVSHPSVTPAQVAAEADPILACLRGAERLGKAGSARGLARAAAPAFAASGRWDTWAEVLDLGLAAARDAGTAASADHAWFRHELAILALCTGDARGAREEAVAATRMRDVGADKRGLAADRRVLALAGGERVPLGGTGEAGGASRGGIGRRGMLMTAGAAVVLVVTLAAVVGMGSESPDDADTRNPVGSTGSVDVGATTPAGGPIADRRSDPDKPAPSTGGSRPSTTATPGTTVTASARTTTPAGTTGTPTASATASTVDPTDDPAPTTTEPSSDPPGTTPPPPTSAPPTTEEPPATTPPPTSAGTTSGTSEGSSGNPGGEEGVTGTR